MAQQKGSNTPLILGFEDQFKTAPATGFSMPYNSNGIKGEQVSKSSKTIRGGSNRNPSEPFMGNRIVEGDIEAPVDSIAFWYWLKGLLGSPTTTAITPTTGPYLHTFKISDSQPSMTLESQYLDLDIKKYALFTGCKVGKLSMSIGGDDELVAKMSVIGAVDNLNDAPFVATPTEIGFNKLSNFQASIDEGGALLSNATELTIDINTNLEKKYVIGGGGVVGSINEGIMEISGRIKTFFDSAALLEKAIGNEKSSLKFAFKSGDDSNLEFEMQEIKYGRNIPDVKGPEGLDVDLSFNAFYKIGADSSAIIARLTNTEAHA